MKYFAGVDGALEETAIWVVDETGQIMKEAGAAGGAPPSFRTSACRGS